MYVQIDNDIGKSMMKRTYEKTHLSGDSETLVKDG